ncbi:M20/M25/M40 family metallo-hydrolase [Gillisia sp. M10.2A]|uniref:Vacuolar membrane protease n=1 Tax=Gillisia lutea TaxID=2909668 RepID=A0ABS9EFY4_9FLAO|nr:M20/M25/M40 family metallo-hydrolase [Gillisia lutea]MCF4100323.1 M20/M25/M40 family metallo-hydrolase [Gillisia lutea]
MLKKLAPLVILILLPLASWFIYYSSMPRDAAYSEVDTDKFSTERAFKHVQKIAEAPHYVGSDAHSLVRNYIVNELQQLGLEVQTQEGYSLTDYGTLTRPQNILARIPGSGNGKALILMSHYDSAGHASYGASDAASGVATVLEGIRAFIANNTAHKNDIIVLFTDAEELGLNGAELFVKNHAWAKDVGLALNFEARGSGGNSFMLLETNGGNAALIEGFIEAHPEYPVTNSLAYSVYKMLPNDTDLTVLREQADINGFNFAFIDDHFDYHSSNDVPANLDMETLMQQGTYLMPLLSYFKDADLTALNSEKDLIYFSLPFGEIISYPFAWILPMLLIGWVIFIVVLIYGFFKKRLLLKEVFKGAIPFLISLIGGALLAWGLWKFCLMIYPEYTEMINGFTYNGYYYIAAVVFLSLVVCFMAYSKFRTKEQQAGVFVFPLFFWLLICTLTAFYLKGAAYFIIPAYFALLQFWIMLRQKEPNLYLTFFLSLPALVLIQTFVSGFPVALGLKILFVAAILTVFLFSLFLPVFGYFKRKKALALLCFIIFNVLFITAHFKADFTEDRPKPNSLVYILDEGTNTATWNSYDKLIDPWTAKYFGETPNFNKEQKETFSSKYGSTFTLTEEAPVVAILTPGVVVKRFSIDSIQDIKEYSVKIAPNRKINRMEFYVDRDIDFENFEVNGQMADSVYLGENPFHIFTNRWDKRLLTYHAANKDTLELKFSIKGEKLPEFTLYESSYDLLANPQLKVPKRSTVTMPKPFVLNDAVIIKKTIKLDE